MQFGFTKWIKEKLSPYPYYKIYNSQSDHSCFEAMTYIFYVLCCLVEWLEFNRSPRKACWLITSTLKKKNVDSILNTINTGEVQGKLNRNNLFGLGGLGKSYSFCDTKFCKNGVLSCDENILPLVWGDMWSQFYYVVMERQNRWMSFPGCIHVLLLWLLMLFLF